MSNTDEFLTMLGALFALYILAVFTPLIIDGMRPSTRAAMRKSRQPGAVVMCACPNREPSPLFGEGSVTTSSALDTERVIAILRSGGCTRILVVGPDGAAVVALSPGPIAERRTA
jgi:hypothetical protein